MKTMQTMKRIVVAAAVAIGMWAVAEAQYTAYIWEVQHPGTISAEAQPLITALRAEVDKILAAGHLAPLRFSGADVVNEGFWLYYEPGRVITTLAYAYPYLTSAQQALVRAYVNTELATAAYAPWTSGNRMDPATGARREWFSMSQMWQWGWMLYDVRFYNLYGLWLYAYNSGDWAVVSNNWSAIRNYYSSNSGQGNIYGTVAGHIGMARMAHRMGDASLATTAANNATAVFNDGLNIATMHNRQQSYFSRRYDSLQGRGLANANWFFMNMSPEVGRYMYDFIRSTAIARHTAFLSSWPHWFVYRPWYGGGWTGHESQGATPEIIGMAMPIERWVLRRSGQELSRYKIQYACHGIGDCYAIEAIVMNISAYGTDSWYDVRTTTFPAPIVIGGNMPPTVTLTSPVNGSTYTAPAILNLAATASDPDGSIANVRFYRGTTLLATDTASPYEYTWADVSSGTYQLRAVAQDNQGATSTSTVVTVTVLSSSTPPVWYTLTTAVNPANGGTVSPASGTYLAGIQIQITATPNANYTFANWSGDATGTNPTITLTMDSTKTLTANFTYTPPVNSSPSVTIISPADGATFTAPAGITITAEASDPDGSIAAVRFYSGATLLNTDSTSPYSYTWTGVPAGSYVLTAQAQDNQGAVGVSPAIGITVSAQPVYWTLTVTVNPSNGGTVVQSPTGTSHLAGTQVSLTATPNAGYEFAGWSGDITGSSTTNPMVVVMDGNKNITANFRAVQSPQPMQPVLQPGEVRVIGSADGYINATQNPNVTIRFRRTTAGKVTVRIYDLRGRLVMERSKDGQAGIDDDIAWNAAEVPAGVYIVQVNGGGVETSKRVVVVR